jgi:thioredoxin-like negative regulator of GroEL
MESVLAQLARKERQRIDIARVELDDQPELADRLGVAAAPTLVLVVDRRVVGRLAGRASATKIEALLDAKLGVATSA